MLEQNERIKTKQKKTKIEKGKQNNIIKGFQENSASRTKRM